MLRYITSNVLSVPVFHTNKISMDDGKHIPSYKLIFFNFLFQLFLLK